MQPQSAFYVSAKDLNPGPHAYTARALTIELSLPPASFHSLSLSFPPSIPTPSLPALLPSPLEFLMLIVTADKQIYFLTLH